MIQNIRRMLGKDIRNSLNNQDQKYPVGWISPCPYYIRVKMI
jgi:hypothetical protein